MTHRPRRLTVPTAVAVAVVVLLAAAGCGTGPRPGVASLGSHTTAAAATGDLDTEMVDYAQCMRAHGAAVPDPVHRAGHAGLTLELPDGASDNPTFQAADATCNHFLAGIIALKRAHQAQIAASQMSALVAYARCMRAHQIPMLDPDASGGLNLGHVAGITGDVGRYSAEFRAADGACRHLLPAGVRDDGSGP